MGNKNKHIVHKQTKFVNAQELTLLVAEDSRAHADLIKYSLTQKGFKLTMVKDGFEAVEEIKRDSDYDAILMDISMPRMDGYEATKRIRALDFSKPIIGISALNFQENMDEGLAAGMNAYLAKPVDTEVLLVVLSDLL